MSLSKSKCWYSIDFLHFLKCAHRCEKITRYKLALIFESANRRKFLGLFGSEAARLLTSNEATLEGYAIKHVFDLCDSIMKNVIVLFIKKYVAVSLYFNLKKVSYGS